MKDEMIPGVRYTQKTHMSVSIRGALENLNRKRNKNGESCFDGDDGRPLKVWQAIKELNDELSKGKRVLPVGDCDDFDFQTGCRGHAFACDLERTCPAEDSP